MDHPWHYYFMAVLYIFAGTMHFVKPRMYMRIMPKYLPQHRFLVYTSGIMEVLLGLGLFVPSFKNVALYGIIVMLALFLTVHFHMLSGEKASAGIPKWILILRLPLQFVLMYWAYIYLKK